MEKNQSQSAHLLIIDDDLDQLRLLVAALRGTSHRVSVATQGDQGYARAMVLQPDLILLDMSMPGRSGVTVARLLKTNPSTQHIPIIFLSARIDAQDRLAGLKAGAVDYITKPFLIEEVLERIRIHLVLAEKKSNPSTHDSSAKDLDGDSNFSSSQPVALTFRKMAMEFIGAHMHESSLKISDVAAHLGVSVQRLNAAFEAADGFSAFEFMRQERMRRAALMLGQSTLTIADVALEVGYANPANFSTEFKKFWGKTPMQFRNESKISPDEWQQRIASRFSRNLK